MLLRIAASLLLAGLATVQALPHSLKARPVTYPDPTIDPFYKAPANLSSYKPGQVIRSRSVVTTITDNVKSSYQVYYRTTNTQNQASGTVTTIWEPNNARSPPQVLAYTVYEDANTLDCNPSWTFVNSSAEGTGSGSTDVPIFIKWALENGIYVTVPDDYGPRATFIAGFEEGMAALDGMRAIKNFYKMPKETPFAITGYSGGAHTTAWAANLASSYASDLNVTGVAHGGTPVDTKGTFNFLNGGTFSGFALGGLVGIANAYPKFNNYILAHVDSTTKGYIAQYRSNNFCLNNIESAHRFTNFLNLINVPDPLNQPIIKSTLARESLLMDVSSVGVAVPKFPRLQWHAVEDEIVPFADEQKFVTQQCAKGANIQFQPFPAAEHITAEFLGIPGALIFLGQVFAGTTPKVVCGSAIPNFVSLTSPGAIDVLGQATVTALLDLNGKKIYSETITLK